MKYYLTRNESVNFAINDIIQNTVERYIQKNDLVVSDSDNEKEQKKKKRILLNLSGSAYYH